MGESSSIEWTHHTFNPWWGCEKVSPGCANCYAEAFAKRVGRAVWGAGAPRRFFDGAYWAKPLRWAQAAAKAGARHRVFCASMADVFEDRPELEPEREKLWALIRKTAIIGLTGRALHGGGVDYSDCLSGPTRRPGLDWLLLTKRPQNIRRMAPADILPLVWCGTTVEDQPRAIARIPELLEAPTRVRFLSCEPLLGPVDLAPWLNAVAQCTGCRFLTTDRRALTCCKGYCQDPTGRLCDAWPCPQCARLHYWCGSVPRLDWVIAGGESGPKARPFDLAWARSLRAQCAAAKVPFFMKQLGTLAIDSEYRAGAYAPEDKRSKRAAAALGKDAAYFTLVPTKAKGGDWNAWGPENGKAYWPEDLRVREFPA